jgi:hypothetical protein
MIEDPDSPAPKRVPKYKAPGFMQKEIALWMSARNATIISRRNGEDDGPIAPIQATSTIRPIHSTRGVIDINRTIR